MDRLLVSFCALALVTLPSCSSSDSPAQPGAATEKDAGTGSGADVVTNPDAGANCVKPGVPANEKGVGVYCEPGSNVCVSPTFCTADFDLTPAGYWFCTTFCQNNTDCGSGAACDKSTGTGGCVPLVCLGPSDAGGADASTIADAGDAARE